jgi:hypothetical protein
MNPRHPQKRRAYWLKMLHQWHWISSALCLIGMLGFAVTGWTLNNAAHIEAKPRVTTRQAQLPRDVLQALQQAAPAAQDRKRPGKSHAALPAPAAAWLEQAFGTALPDSASAAEWSPEEVYVSLPRPGGDAWMAVDLETGEAEYERTDRGVIAYLNDLHKGRHTGVAWSWFLDVFACACLIFSLTGLLLLKLHAGHRRATWPMVGLGIVVPALLAFMFIH